MWAVLSIILKRRNSLLLLLLCLLLAGCGINQSTTSTTTSSTTSTTLSGSCAIGAFLNGLNNTPSFETAIGKNLAVNMWYIDWNTNFPSADCDSVDSYGAIPMLTWEPFLNTVNTLDAITNGNYDAYLARFAQDSAAWGKMLYLRFAHEMNGDWYPWDGYHNGGSLAPAKYIAAWRHVHAIFEAAGANNIKWVWSPNSLNCPAYSWNQAVNYYPGDAYVDWIGVDGYNWGQGNWESFDTIFGGFYSTFSGYAKPFMIAEFACAEESGKAAWISDAFLKIKTSYPKIRIVTWFDILKERDWRIDSSVSAFSAFVTAVSDPYFSAVKLNY